MGTKICDSNPYYKDPALRLRMILKSVETSSAIEGIRAPFKDKVRLLATVKTVPMGRSGSRKAQPKS